MDTRTVSVVLILLLSVGAIPIADAQDAPNGSTANTTNASNTTETPTPGVVGSQPSIGIGSPIPEVPDPKTIATKLTRGITSSLANGAAKLIDEFNYLIFDLPAPGEPDDPDSWMADDSGWWPAVRAMYFLFTGLAIATLVGLWMWTHRLVDAHERRRRWKELGKGVALILAGYYLTVLGLHIGGSLSLALAPSGAEFLSGPENMLKFELGVVLGAIIVLVKNVFLLIGIGVLFIQWFLAHVLVAFWPVFVLLWVSGQDTLRSIGAVGISTFILLIGLKFFQAAIMRFLFEIPLTHNTAVEGVAAAASAIGVMLGVFVALIGLPYIFVKTVIPEAVLAIGGSAVRATGESGAVQSAKNRVGDVRERFGRSRGAEPPSTRQSTPRPSVRGERSRGVPTGVRPPDRSPSTPTPDGGRESPSRFRRRHHAQSKITYGYQWDD